MGIELKGITGLLANATRSLPNLFPELYTSGNKHDHYTDFGWKSTLTPADFYKVYQRHGFGSAAVRKTVRKTWQTSPVLRLSGKGEPLSTEESELLSRLGKLRLWQKLAMCDRRALVTGYSGLILRIADSRPFHEPVEGTYTLDSLVEVIPAWSLQLTVSQWDTDTNSETYGKPLMYAFNETSIQDVNQQSRSFEVHPDRVIIWSEDGTVGCRSMLEPGYNDLCTVEKISGAGGEGFWKNAKNAPVIEVDPKARISEMASAMGTTEDKVFEAMSEQTDAYNKGFDKMLMLMGMKASSLSVSLPVPEHFHNVALQSFAASIEMPIKILTGMQTGERASTEDAAEWANTCMSRRNDWVVPLLLEFMQKLAGFGMVRDADWWVEWEDLTATTLEEKLTLSEKMAKVNQLTPEEPVFTTEEMREVAGYEEPEND